VKVFLNKKENGVKINVDGVDYEPLAFKSFRPTERNISDFYKAGVKFFCVLSTGQESATKGIYYSNFGESWIDDYTYDFKPIDNQIELFLQNAPEAYLDVMLAVDTRKWWLEKYKDYPDSYWCMSQVCTDEKWRKAAVAYLKAAVAHIEEKYGDRVFAYHILGGTTTEWISDRDYEEASDIKLQAYKAYLNDENAVIPTKEERENFPCLQVFLDPKEHENLISYRKFHADIIADTILYFAKGIREIIGYDKLIGVYYGYLFELGAHRIWNAGHLAYEKVFNSKDVDIISAPIPYWLYRRLDGMSGVMCTVDTLTEHIKLYFQEDDQRSFLPMLQFGEGRTLVGGGGATNRQEMINMLRREFMHTQSKGLALWWFDMFEGWYYDDQVMDEIRKCGEFAKLLTKKPNKNVAEIAVIADPESLYYVNKTSIINSEVLDRQRSELSKIGAPYDLYSSCSLETVDFTPYKMVIFLSQFKADEKYTKLIDEKIKKDGKTVVWVYAPNYVSEDGLSIDSVREITEMNLQVHPRAETIIRCGELVYGFSVPKKETFYVKVEGDDGFTTTEPNIEVLGRYQISYNPALVRKDCGDYVSVFSGSGYLSGDVFRMIAEKAGVHIYLKDSFSTVYVREGMIGVYHRKQKDAVIYVALDGDYKDLYTGTVYTSKNKEIYLPYTETTMAKLLIKE
jgi:hypothetical protein